MSKKKFPYIIEKRSYRRSTCESSKWRQLNPKQSSSGKSANVNYNKQSLGDLKTKKFTYNLFFNFF